jgi:hypothetical protein
MDRNVRIRRYPNCSLKETKKHFKFLEVTFLWLNFPVCLSMDSSSLILTSLKFPSTLQMEATCSSKIQGVIS